jgi:hypothetical protein
MIAEQFRYNNNGKGYDLSKSSGIDQWVSMQTFQGLAQQQVNRECDYAITEKWIEKEGIYARSFLKPLPADDMHRRITYNHTIILKITDLAKAAVNNQTVNIDHYFIMGTEKTPKILPPLIIE